MRILWLSLRSSSLTDLMAPSLSIADLTRKIQRSRKTPLWEMYLKVRNPQKLRTKTRRMKFKTTVTLKHKLRLGLEVS